MDGSTGVAPGCDGDRLRPDALPAPVFQRAVLSLIGEVEGAEARSLGPFQIQLDHDGACWRLRLDELFKRYRHGEIEVADAAEEIKAAARLPGARLVAAGPLPRLARAASLDPSTLRLPCPFDPELSVFFVWELPHAHIPLTALDLRREYGGDLERLQEEAFDRLADKTTQIPAESQGEDARRALGYVSGDGFDAARSLLPELLLAMAEWVPGRLHFIIPTRDLLLVLGDEDPAYPAEGAAHARALFEAAGEERLSPKLYVLTGQGPRIVQATEP
ncbi:MAG TPA: hypothetical protein PK826_06690 [Anaerolineae bacterium]|jgi:hypothetical protein|nr:hypothetical protein [Anaerolineae bacterium]